MFLAHTIGGTNIRGRPYTMADIVISAIAAAGFVLVSFFGIYHLGTIHRLKKHQAEWDQKKQIAIENGQNSEQIEWLYLAYIAHLYETRHILFGACFPRK